jgi:hypothetical protein
MRRASGKSVPFIRSFFFVLRILHQVILSLFGRFKWECCAQDGRLCHYIEGKNELKKQQNMRRISFLNHPLSQLGG